MTAAATRLVNGFNKLDPAEQRLVWNELAQAVAPADYGPLSDDTLTEIADQTFVLLDKEEANGDAG